MQRTRTVPIVGLASDMVAAGLMRSLARPGGNVTGVSLGFEIDGKRQDLLMEAVLRRAVSHSLRTQITVKPARCVMHSALFRTRR